MNKLLRLALISNLMVGINVLHGQNLNRVQANDFEINGNRKVLQIPDIPGYKTLTGDFHMHTVFSDGDVWPITRVEEAWREGLDVIAITDHVEYQPHDTYITGDLNSPFDIAKSRAEEQNIILIHGTEITRSMPPGHFNALFIEDATALSHEDPMVQLEEANKQGAFVLWNHPGWVSQQPDTTMWWELHTDIYKKGWLHGIEVFNHNEWYPVVLGWCIEKGLTVFANSDIHMPVNQKYDLTKEHSHRPLTLLFCDDRTEDGVKEALFKGRTLGWFGDILVGKEALIQALFNASVRVHSAYILKTKNGIDRYHYELENSTDLTFEMKMKSVGGEERTIKLLPESMAVVDFPEAKDTLFFELINCYADMQAHPLVTLKINNQ